MTEINIIIDEDIDKTVEAKKIIIRDLIQQSFSANDLKKMEESYPTTINTFYNLIEKHDASDLKYTIPEIFELIVKSIITLFYDDVRLNYRVMPLILLKSKKGGIAIAKFRPVISKVEHKKIEKSNQIRLSFDKIIKAVFYHSLNETYNIPINENVIITGLFILHSNGKIFIDFADINQDKLSQLLKYFILFDKFTCSEHEYLKQQLPLSINELNPVPSALITYDNPILRELEKLNWIRFSPMHLATERDLISTNMNIIYHYYTKSEQVRLQHLHDKLLEQDKYNRNIEKEQNNINEYKKLIWKKLNKKITKTYATVDDLIKDIPERKIILLAKQKELEYQAALRNNKCEHIELLKKIRQNNNIVKQNEIFDKLKQFFDKTSALDIVTCKVCKFNIICAHELAIYQAGEQLSINKLKVLLNKYYSLHNKDYICNICYEIIDELNDTDVLLPQVIGNVNEDLKIQIIAEIYRLKRYVISKIPYKNVADLIQNNINNKIEYIAKSLKLSKTTAEQELKRKLIIYIEIYIFAYFIYLAQKKVLVIVGSKKNDVASLIEYVIKIINTYSNVTIRKSIDINIQWIKYKLIEVFKEINNIVIHDEGEIASELIIAHDYNLQYQKYISKLPKENISIFNDLKSLYVDGAIPLGFKLNKNVIPSYIYASAILYKYNLVDNEPIYKLLTIKDEFVVEYSESYNTLLKYYEEFKKCEQIILRNTYQNNLRIFVSRQVGVKLRPPKMKLSRIYDQNGRVHSFNYDADKKDYLCSICNQWISELEQIDDQVIRDALIKKDKYNVFFEIFNINCPKKGVHEYPSNASASSIASPIASSNTSSNASSSKKCTKCGFDGPSEEYYNKYQAEFEQINKKRKAENITNRFVREIKVTNYTEYDNWVFDFNKILKLAEFCDVNSKLILALGDYDKNDYTKISSGEYIPAIMSHKINTRFAIIYSFIKLLITDYNKLRYAFTREIKGPLSAIIQDINHTTFVNIFKLLPSIYTDQFDRIKYFQENKTPNESVEFLLEMLCDMLLQIAETISSETSSVSLNETSTIRNEFVKYFIARILRGSELRTKWNYFNWSLLFPDGKQVDVEIATDTDDVEDIKPQDDDEENIDPLSLDAFDVDAEDMEDITITHAE